MQCGIRVELERALSWIGAPDCFDARGDVVHPFDVGRRLIGIGEREIGNLVPSGEMTHQMPGAELASLVEGKQHVRFEPEDAHQATSLTADCAFAIMRGAGAGPLSAREPRVRTAGSGNV